MIFTNLKLKAAMLMLASVATIGSALAGAPDYYMGKGRIALSSDGNMHDNDDMHATKMTLMILAKAGLQEQTKLYTYADHIWGNEENDLEIMRSSAEITGVKFGFTACRFMAAVENPQAAYKAMCKEIVKSTADDPLFIIAAGPMNVVGMGLDLANKENPEALNHVTVISHSDWNNKHADKPMLTKNYHSEPEEPHTGWTWSEMEEAFGERVNFNQIVDQNGTGTGEEVYRSKDKFSAKTWKSWEWMAKHKDPNIRWVRNNTGINCGPDYSDAGMAYYLCADLDGVRGDENGNPAKLEKWIGTDPIPAPKGQGNEIGDFIAFEAESAEIPEGSGWVIHREGDELYDQIFGMIGATNDAYIECMTGPITGADVDAEADVITYKFTPKVSGKYHLSGRLAQQLLQDGEIVRWDLCNDVFVKMDGDFTSGNDVKTEDLKSFNKFYGRGYNAWGSFNKGEINHKHVDLIYDLKAGCEYTLSLGARSKGVCIDYFVLSTVPLVTKSKLDLALVNHSDLRPDADPAKYMAVDFEKISGWGGDFVDATVDKSRNALQIAQRLKWGAAETTYRGEAGKVSITLNAMMESDGESTFKVYIDGKKVGEVTNPRTYGTDVADYKVKAYNLTEKPIKIKKGATIRVEFCSATNGLVPEGDTTATSRGRWKSLVVK